MRDPAFVQNLLSSLPGVDPNDPRIKEVLSSFQQEKKDENANKKKVGFCDRIRSRTLSAYPMQDEK